MKLLIVESPNKIKKITGYLDKGWEVAASVGHICDLPDKEMGISPPDFKPSYVISSDKKKVVSKLKSLASKATEVYLATDPDREGEAIAYHLMNFLSLKNPKRITFSEITKNAIQKAIANPRSIDLNLVKAQESRRVLDRIVGYHVSPILSNQSGIALSAGRVQSPALKLVVYREREIRKFRTRNFYNIEVEVCDGVTANLDPAGWCNDSKHIFEYEVAEAICKGIETLNVTLAKKEEKIVKPRAPFTTSSLQQAASSIFKMSPSETMKAAQKLFEQGLITYHRTDTPNLAEDSFFLFKEFLTENGITCQEKQLKWSTKAGAQEAHEAIRPTSPEKDSCSGTAQEQKLYLLIRERTLCSVVTPAIDTVTSIEFASDKEISAGNKVSHAKLRITGKVEKESGWRNLCKLESKGGEKSDLPRSFNEGESYTPNDKKIIQKSTQPPPRFTEATLVKALEKLEIGRPSTYASILENIKSRNYINLKKDKKGEGTIEPSEVGEFLIDAIDNQTFMNLDYTKILEKQLDLISAGKNSYLKIVRSVHDTVLTDSKSISIKSLIETQNCAYCSQSIKRLKSKKRGGGYFWVHLKDAHDCHDFIPDDNGNPSSRSLDKIQANCPKCNGTLIRIYSKKTDSHFWVHEDNEQKEKCTTYIKDNDGKPATA